MSISPDTIATGFGSIFSKGGASMMKWFGWFIWSGVIMGGLYAVYVYMQYKIKYVYGVLGAGSNIDGITIRAIKNDRIAVVKEKGAEKWRTLFSRETFEPFETRHVYPGNIVMGIKIGKNMHIPTTYNVKDPVSSIEPIPRSIKFWETVESQQANYDYSDYKTKMMPTFMMLGTILFCLILVGLTVYWTTKNVGGALSTWKADLPKLQQIAQGFVPN